MTEPLILRRGPFTLTVVNTEGRFSLRTSGGGNVTPEEFEQITAHVGEQPDAERFLGKIRARMER